MIAASDAEEAAQLAEYDRWVAAEERERRKAEVRRANGWKGARHPSAGGGGRRRP